MQSGKILTSSCEKKVYKQWCSTITPISTKQTIISHLKSLNTLSWLRTGTKCGRVKLVNGIPTLLLNTVHGYK